MRMFEFTKKESNKLLPKAQRYWRRDSSKQGLLLRVYASGTKKWYVQLDRTTYRKLDTWPTMTISHAWTVASKALSEHSQGNTLDSAKVRAGKVGVHEMSDETVAAIQAQWLEIVTPETGFETYETLIASLK